MRMSDLIQLSDFFLPYFFAIKEGLHWRPSTTHFPLVCSVVIIKTYPFIQIRL